MKFFGLQEAGKNFPQDTRSMLMTQEKNTRRWGKGSEWNLLKVDNRSRQHISRRPLCRQSSTFLCHKVEFGWETDTRVQKGIWSTIHWSHWSTNRWDKQYNLRRRVVRNSQQDRTEARLTWKDKNTQQDKRRILVLC